MNTNIRTITTIKVISLILFLSMVNNVKAETHQDDGIIIDMESTRLKLAYGEDTTIKLIIKNIHNTSINVSLEWLFIECGDLTSGEFSEDFFSLKVDETKEIKLHLITSRGIPSGCEDGVIKVKWGSDLRLKWGNTVDYDTVDGEISIDINIEKNMTIPYLICGSLILIIIIILILFFIRWKRKGQSVSPTDRSGQVGENR